MFKHPKVFKFLRPVLIPFSWGYSSFMRIRRWKYESGILKSWDPPVYCISIGNLVLGGTGKTSLCVWFLNWLRKKGFKPVLLTRGYGAKPFNLPFLVNKDSDVNQSGDEPLMVALKCPSDVYVVVDPNRVRGGKWAIENLRPDVFVLDDGFQHLRIKRDLDIILLSKRDLNKREDCVLPAGTRRERWDTLKKADVFLINLYPDEFLCFKKMLNSFYSYFNIPVFSFYLTIPSLIQITYWKSFSLSCFKGQKYILISGLADPQKFETTAKKFLGPRCVRHFVFPDHHNFTLKDWQKVKRYALKNRCELIICSLKDGVKLKNIADDSLFALDFDIKFGPFIGTDLSFSKWLEKHLTFFDRKM